MLQFKLFVAFQVPVKRIAFAYHTVICIISLKIHSLESCIHLKLQKHTQDVNSRYGQLDPGSSTAALWTFWRILHHGGAVLCTAGCLVAAHWILVAPSPLTDQSLRASPLIPVFKLG